VHQVGTFHRGVEGERGWSELSHVALCCSCQVANRHVWLPDAAVTWLRHAAVYRLGSGMQVHGVWFLHSSCACLCACSQGARVWLPKNGFGIHFMAAWLAWAVYAYAWESSHASTRQIKTTNQLPIAFRLGNQTSMSCMPTAWVTLAWLIWCSPAEKRTKQDLISVYLAVQREAS
jgi:hypothetical protein